MSLKIAVVSDLHCHPRRAANDNRTHFFSDGARVAGNRHPVQYLLELIKSETSNISAEILALPGDVADRADHQGFIVGVYAVREIRDAIGARNLIATLGNHDVDSRSSFTDDPFFAAKNMFPDFPIREETERDRFFNQGFAIVEGDNYRFVSINSVSQHTSKELAESGRANDVQISALQKALENLPKKPFQICLVHHHPIPHEELQLGAKDLLIKGELLLNLLEKLNFDLVIHGHKHHPRLRYSPQGRLPIFSSGSLSAAIDPITGSACRNTFHLLELFERDDTIKFPRGTVKTWDLKLDKGWELTNRKSSSFPGFCGFGCHDSIPELAETLDKLIPTPGLIHWSDARLKIEKLQFLIPTDLEALSKELKARHNIELSPDSSDPVVAFRAAQI